MSVILLASGITIAGASAFLPSSYEQEAEAQAQTLSLSVSGAANEKYDNHFFAMNIQEIIINDPGARDSDKQTVTLQVRGETVPRVHLADGLWYQFTAEEDTFGIYMDLLSDGARDSNIAVADTTPADTSKQIGLETYTIKTNTNAVGTVVAASWIREITGASTIQDGFTYIEVDQTKVFRSVPNPIFETATTLNYDLELTGKPADIVGGDNGLCEVAEFNLADTDCDWPYIRLIPLNENESLLVQAGSESVVLSFSSMEDSITSTLNRSAYPVNSEIAYKLCDFMWNTNPEEVDQLWFVLNRDTGVPTKVLNSLRGGIAKQDVLPIMTALEFDPRQVLEIDPEGISSIKWIFAYSTAIGSEVNFVADSPPFLLKAENGKLVSEFDAITTVYKPGQATAATNKIDGTVWTNPAGDLLPVVRINEGSANPNSGCFNTGQAGKGSKTTLYAGSRDRVASFDYFDVINSAAIQANHGFVTVDAEVYNSADRAVFTVTDPDQNLRTSVVEEPSAIMSNTFVKIGTPYPLGNNPVFKDNFGKQTVNYQPGANTDFNFASTAIGGVDGTNFDRMLNNLVTNQLAPIREAAMLFEIDPDDPLQDTADEVEAILNGPSAFALTDVTGYNAAGVAVTDTTPIALGSFKFVRINADTQIVQMDMNKNGRIDADGNVLTGDIIMMATEHATASITDIKDAVPADSARDGRTQKTGLDFATAGLGATPDRPSAIIINSQVTLKDLNKFTTFTALGTQIVNNGLVGNSYGLQGQAFPVDPMVAATAIFTNAAGTIVNKGSVTNTTAIYTVDLPEYNLIRAELGELKVTTEATSSDSLSTVAVQMEAICPTTKCTNGMQVSQLVDFTPFGTLDVTATSATGTVTHLPSTKAGTGSFRVVDFLTTDWDADGVLWPTDTDEPFEFITLRFTVMTIGLNSGQHENEASELITIGNQVMGIDVIGLVTVIPPPVVAGGTSTYPASRTIDEITMVSVENIVYRVQVKEEGPNSSVFSGRMDFMTVNQFDTVQNALQDIVFSGDPVKAIMPNRFIPPNRLAFINTDLNVMQGFRGVGATFIYETSDGSVEWNKSAFSFGQGGFVTVTDEDLNRRPDATERYNMPEGGFVFFELGKQRVLDETLNAVDMDFNSRVHKTLLETGPNTGTFVGKISMPKTINISTASGLDKIQGTADDTAAAQTTQQRDLEVNYIDIRDRSSVRQEFDSIANIRTTLGDVVLDRSALPPGSLMFVEIHDNDHNTSGAVRNTIDLRTMVIKDTTTSSSGWGVQAEGTSLTTFPAACDTFTEDVTASCDNAAPIMEITIFNNAGKLVSMLPAGLLDLAAAGTSGITAATALNEEYGTGIVTGEGTYAILPILNRDGLVVTEAIETGPNTGIFEFEVRMPGPTKDARFPVTLPSVLTAGTLANPIIKSNQPIQVTYTDPADEAGETEDEEELATFLTNTARVMTDKLEYGLGDRIEIIIEEPDFNLDSRAVDEVAFSILDLVTDKFDTEFGADSSTTDFGTVINSITNLRTNLTKFRETDFNSGVFVVAIEELVNELIDRGETGRLLYFDKTPSGGGAEIRVQYTFMVVSILPEIVFDKEEYTPFDEIVIRIVSPDSNNDPDRIETISPLISSSSESLGRKSLPETGPNTGIFEEDFHLTPKKTLFQGDLTAIREDGITVEFRIDSDTVATKSVFINYHVGQVMFDKDAFAVAERGVLRVIDPDANNHPDTIDTLNVRFWSTTDRGGLLVTLRETGDRTGIFEEIITFTPDEESSGTRLRVSEGDTVTAKYTDNTLPAPASLDANSVYTVEIEELFASALIGALVSPMDRAVASEPALVDQTGATLTDVSAGSQVLIQSKITNAQTKKQSFAYIVQIKDNSGVTVSLSWMTGELPSKDSLAAAQSWIPEVSGEYTVEVFVWISIDNPSALSPVRTLTTTIT